MSSWLLLVACSAGFVVGGCGHGPPPVTANRAAPGAIAWPSALDHASTTDTHRAAAAQLLVEGGTEAAMVTMQEVMLRQQLTANPILKPYEGVMRKFLEKHASFAALREDLVTLYVERFTELQLRQMLAFYQTSTGKLAVHELPKVIEAAASLGARKVEAHLPELTQAIQQQGTTTP